MPIIGLLHQFTEHRFTESSSYQCIAFGQQQQGTNIQHRINRELEASFLIQHMKTLLL